MTAPVNDGTPRRDFVEYDHPDGAYTLEAHVVTPQTVGAVPVAGGTSQEVVPGDVLVRNGNTYEVHSKDAWEEMGLQAVREQQDLEQSTVEEEPEAQFDPSTQDASAVRRYLRRPDISDEERARVETAEREGKNRSSAFPV